MARLPDLTAIGAIPSARSGRSIASFDTTAIGRGQQALGQAIESGAAAEGAASQSLASAGFKAASALAEYGLNEQYKADALNEAKAHSSFLVSKTQLDSALADETDPDKIEQIKQQYQSEADKAASVISDPRKQELFKLKLQPSIAAADVAAKDRVFAVQKDASIADTIKQLSTLQDAGLRAKDEATKAQVIQSGQDLISRLEEGQYITKVEAQKQRQAWVQGYAIKSIQAMAPEDRINALRQAPQTTDQILDRIGNVESGGNPTARASTSSAMGQFQFTRGTWAQMIADSRPDIAKGRSVEELTNDKAVQDLRADPAISRQMAGVLLSQNAAALKGAGIQPTAGNLYLAHFLGAGDAIKVLKADPNAPVAGIVNQGSIDANQSVLAGKTAGTVTNWANRKMGGVQSSVPQFDAYNLPDKEANLIEYHRDNLRKGTYLDRGGDISTVYITGVTGPDGRIYNVPGYWDGKLHTDVKEISDHAAQIGWDKWPSYATGKQADAAAERDHKIVDADTTKFRQAQEKSKGIHSFIPEADKSALLDQAHNEIVQNQQADQQRAVQAIKARSEDFERQIIDATAGKTPLLARGQIEQDASLDEQRRNTLLRQYDHAKAAIDKGASDITQFNSAMNTKGFAWNPYDKDQKDWIEAGFAARGGDVNALQSIVNDTGMVPSSAVKTLRGSMVSQDPQRVSSALTVASNLLQTNPNAFVGQDGRNDIENQAVTFRHYVENFGMTAQQATQHIMRDQSPEYQAQVKARVKGEDVNEIIKKRLSPTDLKSAFNEGLPLIGRPEVEFTPEARANAMGDFGELFKDRYLETGDVDKAKAQAVAQLKKVWGVSHISGVTGGVLMRYPPEKAPAYANVPDAADRIATQAIEAIKGETGQDVDRKRLIITPTPRGETARAYMAGQEVPYSLSWADKDGVIHMLNPGRAFMPDGKKLREASSEGRRQQFETARQNIDLANQAAQLVAP